MLVVFCDKNKKEDLTFVYPNLDSDIIIHKYFSIDNLNAPSKGDMVIVSGEFYKVFSSIFDYGGNIIYITVEKV